MGIFNIFLRGFLFLMVVSFVGCVSKPEKDKVVENSLNNVSEQPVWTIDGKFQAYLKTLPEDERKGNLFTVARYSVKKRGDMDICYKYARLNVETEISSSVGQAVSALTSEAIGAGDMSSDEANRVQEAVAASKTQMAIVGLSVSEKYWQQVVQMSDNQPIYECFVLAKMDSKVYKKQLQSSLAKIEGISETQRKLLDKAAEEVDDVNQVFSNAH